MKRAIVTSLAGLCLASTAIADTLDAFADPGACYARAYDEPHLAAHPAQQVARISLVNGGRVEAGAPVLTFGFGLRDGSSYIAAAYCDPAGDGAVCSIEGDGGNFQVAMRGGDLLLTVGDFLAIEGDMDFSPDLATSADDRVFLLRPGVSTDCF